MVDEINFIGLANYKALFKDPVFYTSIVNTVIITVVMLVFQNGIAVFLAVVLNNRSIRGRNYFRTIFYIPSLLSTVVMGNTWRFILNVYVGALGIVLRRIGVEDVSNFDVFANRTAALSTICLTHLWQFCGYMMVILLGGLQAIPEELYEAAEIDGAGHFRVFRSITLPLLVPALTITTFLILVFSLRLFEPVFVLTGGGPGNATETVGTYIYNSAFAGLRLGYGTAIASVLFVAIMVVSVFQLKFTRSLEVEL